MLIVSQQSSELATLQRTDTMHVAVLPGRVVVRAPATLSPTELKVHLTVGGQIVRLPVVLASRHQDPVTAATYIVLAFAFSEYVMAPQSRLRITASGVVIHDQPLMPGDTPVTGQIETVSDGHASGWVANILGEPIGPMSLQVDELPERRVRPIACEHAYTRLVPHPGVQGFRIRLPKEGLDGAPRRLRVRVDGAWLPEFWCGLTAPGDADPHHGISQPDISGAQSSPRHTPGHMPGLGDHGAGPLLLPAPESPPDPIPQPDDYVFDAVFYAACYADVANEAAVNPDFDLAAHFWSCGIDEGRHPSVFFDIEFVQHRLRRLLDAPLGRRDAVGQYFATPPAERFVPNRWFSPHAVRAIHADCLPPGLSDYELFAFYVEQAGVLRLSPSGLFNEAAYCESYPDIGAAVGAGAFRSGFHHFLVQGWRMGRRNLPGFGEGVFPPEDRGREERDTLFYRSRELRPLVPWFSETFYLDVYPDVRELKRQDVVRSGLDHFRAVGCAEGRVPHPALLAAVQRAAGDLRAFDREVAGCPPPHPGHALPIGEAAALYGYLARDIANGERLALSALLWPMVAPPSIGGTFDVERYLAANPDLAQLYGQDRARAFEHWCAHGLREGRIAPGSNVFAHRRFDTRDLLNGGHGVNLFGPISLPNGLGVACRGIIKALRQCGVEVDLYDVSGLLCPGALIDIVGVERLRHSVNLIFLNPDQIVPLVARFGTALFDHSVNVGFWVWELPSARPEWRSILAGFDLIVTPSAFCTDTFAGETDAPVFTVPYVVDRDEIRAQLALYQHHAAVDRVIRAKVAGQRIVLFIMDASSYMIRKGVDVFLRVAALIEASHPGEFLFVLKTHSRDLDAARHLAEDVPATVQLIDEILPRPDLYRLKQVADIYFSPHRSEGFGLNIFESLVIGVPVLCSPFGGGPDALPADYPLFLRGKLQEVGPTIGPYRAAAIWFEPDADAAAAMLLGFFDRQRDHIEQVRRLGDRLAGALSSRSVGETLRGLLARRCGLGLDLKPLSALFDRTRHECFNLEVGGALRDGSRSVSAMVAACITPRFSVITPTCNSDPVWLREIYGDLCAQTLPSWEWCLYDDGSTDPATLAELTALRARDARVRVAFGDTNRGISDATNQAVRISSGEYAVMVDHDDRLDTELLAAYARAIDEGGRPALLYCDEDKLLPDGTRRDHYLKPDWSPEHAMSTMYALHCLCVRKSLFLSLGGYRADFNGAQDHDFLLRAASTGAAIRHVDRVLYHWRVTSNSVAMNATAKPYAMEAGLRAVTDHLRRLGVAGSVEPGHLPGTYRVRPAMPAERVTINILTSATRRHGASGSYVDTLVRSILAYPAEVDFELRLIVDAPAVEACAPLARLDRRVSIVPYARASGPFNFSDKANVAVRGSETSRVVLLNDDMEALDAAWLPALLEPLELPGVGVVGGRLLYANDTVQHAGIVLGVNGSASHVFAGVAADHVGYNGFTHVMRNYSAVTGAMMAFRRSLFDQLGGFDPTFPIDFNDTDFCLRVLEAGRRVVFTPFAQMRHFESRSAVRLAADTHDEYRFCRRWRRYVDRDPYYNRNLRRDSSTFEAVAYA